MMPIKEFWFGYLILLYLLFWMYNYIKLIVRTQIINRAIKKVRPDYLVEKCNLYSNPKVACSDYTKEKLTLITNIENLELSLINTKDKLNKIEIRKSIAIEKNKLSTFDSNYAKNTFEHSGFFNNFLKLELQLKIQDKIWSNENS